MPLPEEELTFQLPTAFTDPAVERRHRKERLAGALRLFGRFGFEEGVAGHITARDPEFPDPFGVNPFGMSFQHVKVAEALGGHKAVILRNHGLLTAAGSVDAAAYSFLTMERSAQAELAFQPLFDQISRTDPDLFE